MFGIVILPLLQGMALTFVYLHLAVFSGVMLASTAPRMHLEYTRNSFSNYLVNTTTKNGEDG